MLKIRAVKLNEDPMQFYGLILNRVDEDKQNRIKRYVQIEDARRSLLGELMVRLEIMRDLEIKNEDIHFYYNSYGKPFLKGLKNYHFNISHSGEWVVCVFNQSPIGVDIEKIMPIDLGIASRFFAKKEYDDLMERREEERLSYFYDLWTAKESYIKALGKGLTIPLNSFSIDVQFNNICMFGMNNKEWGFKGYAIDPDYKMTVCAKTDQFPVQVTIKGENEIYQEII